MTVDTPTITQADTAVLLRAKLGALRSWPDFLVDNIRGKQDVAGFQLLPCARVKGARGRYRIVYSVTAANDFIEKVLAADPAAGKQPIEVVSLPIETDRYWKLNTFDQHGAPLRKPI